MTAFQLTKNLEIYFMHTSLIHCNYDFEKVSVYSALYSIGLRNQKKIIHAKNEMNSKKYLE